MLDKKYIMELVKRYAASEEGRREIKKRFGIDFSLNRAGMKLLGENMKHILYERIRKLIGSFKREDITVGEPFEDKNGVTHLNISFLTSALPRESLQPHDYPEGVPDIVLHFAHGWQAKNYAYGNWLRQDGNYRQVRSRRYKPPDGFLELAVLEFNNIAQGIAQAELKAPYK